MCYIKISNGSREKAEGVGEMLHWQTSENVNLIFF